MKKNTIAIEDAVLLDNKLWFILSDYKCLVSMDIETKETKSYTIPTSGPYTQKRAYGSMALVGGKIYLIPFAERELMQFDVDLEEFTKVEIDSRITENESPLFLGVGVYQNYIFIMGVNVPVVLRVNTVNNDVDYIMDWHQEAENLIFDSNDAYFRKQSVICEHKLFVPFCNANAVLEIDCIGMKSIVHRLGTEKQGYSGICYDGSCFWLSPRKNGSMVEWNLATNRINAIQIVGLKKLGKTLTYAGLITCNKEVLLLPTAKRQMLDVDAENVSELSGAYSFVQDNEKHIIIYDKNNGIFTVIDKTSNLESKIEIEKLHVDIEKVLQENHNLVVENEMIGIQRFVELICEKL